MSHPQDSDSVLNIRFSKRKVERILKNSSDICSFTHFLLLLHKINCTWQFENEFSLRSLALSLHKIGCTSAKYSIKLDVLLSVCTIFALTDHKVCDNINNIS